MRRDLTGIVGRTKILPITPSSCASTSIVALSVSMDSRTAPAVYASPSLTFHSEMLPSVMVGDCANRSSQRKSGTWTRGKAAEYTMAGMRKFEYAATAEEAWTAHGEEGERATPQSPVLSDPSGVPQASRTCSSLLSTSRTRCTACRRWTANRDNSSLGRSTALESHPSVI